MNSSNISDLEDSATRRSQREPRPQRNTIDRSSYACEVHFDCARASSTPFRRGEWRYGGKIVSAKGLTPSTIRQSRSKWPGLPPEREEEAEEGQIKVSPGSIRSAPIVSHLKDQFLSETLENGPRPPPRRPRFLSRGLVRLA